MQVTIQSVDGDVCRLAVSGEVIQRQLRKFVDPLESDQTNYGKQVLCDLSATSLLDSAGVSWFLVAHKRCRENHGRFVMHSIPELIMNVIKVLRLNLVFDIAENEAAALKLANEPISEEPRGEVSYRKELADSDDSAPHEGQE